MLIAVNKPIGLTSFDVVRQIRKATGVRKVGHAGTLDPFAEGVLLIGIGRDSTRRLGEFLKGDKEYLASVVLGIVTDTYDPTGKVVEKNQFKMPDKERICSVLDQFKGDILQIPPLFSAIKVNGVRMYKIARKGIEIERKPRKVTIKEIELIHLTEDGFKMRVCCSHGTYIRSLAYDIGRVLGVGAHLGQLTRTRVGDYTLDQAVNLDKFISDIV
ncbi:MAG: tRNA pseudouridine(55) synthase TruB [Candidatus Hatepunaea meridiana]|nr:tRNA pseudouridine(55) synthase TruB [Candidatus Hatepunaea meridiana]